MWTRVQHFSASILYNKFNFYVSFVIVPSVFKIMRSILILCTKVLGSTLVCLNVFFNLKMKTTSIFFNPATTFSEKGLTRAFVQMSEY